MKREKAIEAVNELPQEFDLEALMAKLVFMEKIEKGLKQLDESFKGHEKISNVSSRH